MRTNEPASVKIASCKTEASQGQQTVAARKCDMEDDAVMRQGTACVRNDMMLLLAAARTSQAREADTA